MFLLWFRQLPRCGDWTLASVPPPPRAGPVLLTLLFFLLVPWCCVVLYIFFHWSGAPVCSQLVFCMHLCVWKCTPDASVERDVLHVHHSSTILFSSLFFNWFILLENRGNLFFITLHSFSWFFLSNCVGYYFQHNVESRGDSEPVFLVLDLSRKVPSVFLLRKMLLRKYSAVLIFLNGQVGNAYWILILFSISGDNHIFPLIY